MKRETEVACARWAERQEVLEAVQVLARDVMNNPDKYRGPNGDEACPRTAAIIAAAIGDYLWGPSRGMSRLKLRENFPDFSLADMDAYRQVAAGRVASKAGR